jgi:hypothetical protein
LTPVHRQMLVVKIPNRPKATATVSESYNSMDITSSDACLSLHHVYNTEEFKLCDCELIQRNFAPKTLAWLYIKLLYKLSRVLLI